MYIFQINEYPKYLKKPYDKSDNHNCVEDVLDRTFHRDIIVDNP
jgi:hypothetical protein